MKRAPGHRVFHVFVIAALCVSPAALHGASPELVTILEEGEGYFRRATESTVSEQSAELYRQALIRYEWLYKEAGIRNGKLLYNIGNTHYRLGNLGKAILYYRRAELYMPGDPQLRHNLRYLRSQRTDMVNTRFSEGLPRAAFFMRTILSPLQIVVIFVAAFAGGWATAAFLLVRKKSWQPPVIVLCALVAAVFLALALTGGRSPLDPAEGVITIEEVTARRGDSESYESSFQESLHEGTEFRLLEERSGWYFIEVGRDNTGWIPSSAAELVEPRMSPL